MSGSRFADRLEASSRARVLAQREARAQHMSSVSGRPSEGDSLSTSSSGVNLHKMVPSHRGMTHDIVERNPPPAVSTADEPSALLPTAWSEKDKLGGLEVLADGTEVKFGGHSKTPRECGIYYFEVWVVSKGREGYRHAIFLGMN